LYYFGNGKGNRTPAMSLKSSLPYTS